MEGLTGTISRTAGDAYYVAPSGGRSELGPMESCIPGLARGDRVAVMPLTRGYVIVGQLPAA